jgi:hypothetical protein
MPLGLGDKDDLCTVLFKFLRDPETKPEKEMMTKPNRR